MNLAQATAKVRKILGPSARIEVDNRALVGEARAQAVREVAAMRETLKLCEKAVAARRLEVLQADARYQELLADLVRIQKAHELKRGEALRDRVTIGCIRGIFHVISATGDNLDEAVAKLTEGK